MNIIRKQADVPAASDAALAATYAAMTGNPLPETTQRGAKEAMVCQSLLCAENAAGRLGVPKGTAPTALTREERIARGDTSFDKAPEPEEQNPFQPGTLAHSLWVASRSATPIERKPRPQARQKAPDGKRSARLDWVLATGCGTTSLQAGAVRTQVLKFLASQPGGKARVETLEAHFGFPCRGHLQKMIERDHVRPCNPPEQQQQGDAS